MATKTIQKSQASKCESAFVTPTVSHK